MLFNTFVHIPGVGAKTEEQIWQAGIHSWDQWKQPFPASLSRAKTNLISLYLEKFSCSKDTSARFYADLLQPRYHWRLFPHFREKTAYLDIETNGMAHGECEITTIALYDGEKISTYVQGRNLEDFLEDISKFEVIATYNGKSFDVPIIEEKLHTRLKQVHLDLRHTLAALGYKGGLKGCEKKLGIDRMELDGVDGYAAVLLWQEFERSGNEKFLTTLLSYNIADAVNLEQLLVHAYNLNIAATPFHVSNFISQPTAPQSPFQADREIIDKLRFK